MFGISGSHRTGKSTLAAEVANETGIFYLKASATPTHRRLGFEPTDRVTPFEKLFIQQEILKDFSLLYSAAPKMFVTDRTPLDMAGYMMTAIDPHLTQDEGYNGAIHQYIADCKALLEKHFKVIYLLQPGIPIVNEDGKGIPTTSVMTQFNAMIIGLTMSMQVPGLVTIIEAQSKIDLRERVEQAKEIVYVIEERESGNPVVAPAEHRVLH